MPNIYFILFEFIVYILFLLCLRHAWHIGAHKVLQLVAGALFGVLLELATIRQLNAYQYGQFLIMVLDVPLCIGVAWGSIIYSAMLFSDATTLSYWERPVLDGLLALNIDLAMDAIAIRLGMWDWGRGLSFQYFGVPYANFWAWFWVVSSFSFGYRLLYQRDDWIGKWLAPLIAVIVGLIGVIGTNAFITFVVPLEVRGSTVIITLSLAIGLIIYLRPKLHIHSVDPLVFWVPLISHVYFLIAGFISGAIFNPGFLLLVSAIMFGVALYLHYPTVSSVIARSVLRDEAISERD